MFLFRRRDTRAMAIGLGLLAAAAVWAWPGSQPGPEWCVALAAIAGLTAAAAVVVTRRSLPADIAIHPVPVEEAVRMLAACAEDEATVLVQFEPDWLRRHRLDVSLDGTLAAQLRPGEAVLIPLPHRLCAVSFNLGLHRIAAAERINGIPGTTTGVCVRVRLSSRPLVIEVTRFAPLAAAFEAGRIRLVRTAGPAVAHQSRAG
ncbi:MAG: hypothetical protein ACRYF2_12810 [Janthinobacterium lividum]